VQWKLERDNGHLEHCLLNDKEIDSDPGKTRACAALTTGQTSTNKTRRIVNWLINCGHIVSYNL